MKLEMYVTFDSYDLNQGLGRAISQPVSRWFPTTASRIRARVRSCGICGGQSGIVAGFLRVLPSNSCSTIIIVYHLGLVK
jgi:hypothetical protein